MLSDRFGNSSGMGGFKLGPEFTDYTDSYDHELRSVTGQLKSG